MNKFVANSINQSIMKRKFEVNKILIPIDFSETSKLALKHAANLCDKFKSELTLLHVFTPSPADILPMLNVTANFEEVKGKVADELNAMGAKFRDDYGVKVSVELREGSPAKEVVKASKELGIDMVVMGTHGASGFEEFFIGSNANKVITSSTVPVFTIQKGADKLGYDRIALPIDSSPHTRDKVSEAV
jgi:nucleotide-binding universal stress UspA family protein